jgi:hypothetical protein
MKRSPEKFGELVRVFGETDDLTKTAARCRMHRSAIYRWMQASEAAEEAGDTASEWFFEFNGVEDFLHNHMQENLKAMVDQVEVGLIKMAAEGYYLPSIYKGQLIYRRDPALIGLDPDVLEVLTGFRDDLYRDPVTRLPEPLLIKVPPSVERQALVLASHAPEVYSKRQQIDLNQNIGGGVTVSHQFNPPQALLPPQQPSLPQIQILPSEVVEAIVVEADVEEPQKQAAPAPVSFEPSPLRSELEALAKMSPEERAATAFAKARKG